MSVPYGPEKIAVICGALLALSCNGGSGPDRQDCLCGTNVNLCRDGAVVGARLGQATNTLAPAPSDVIVAIDRDRELRILGADGMDVVADIRVTQCGDVSGTVTAWARPGHVFATGVTRATGTISGKFDFNPLAASWQLTTGDSGVVEAEIVLGVFTAAELDDVVGAWDSVDEDGLRSGSIDIDGEGNLVGQTTAGCVREGRVSADGSNILGITLTVSSCAGDDGEYSGLGVTELPAGGASGVGAIGLHVNRPDRVLTERWLRP